MEPDKSGTFLRAWRKKICGSQEKLAAAAGYTQGMISQWENGSVLLDLEHIRRLADAMEITSKTLQFRHPATEETVEDIFDELPPPDQDTLLVIGKSLREKAQKS